jgi:hypothetical protein
MSKKIRGAIFVLICGLFLFQAVNHAAKRLSAPPKPAAPAAKAVRPTVGAANTPIIHASFRPLRLSLLRGGFNSVDEFFERVSEDPVLHDFYGDCADRNASMHALPEDIVTVSTFRRGNEIKWAQRPVVVKKGEYVMTFCGKTVLARCGNLVSIAAMQPSEDIPPAVLETPTDVIEPPISYAAAPATAAPAIAAVTPAAVVPVAPVVPLVAAHASRFLFFVPPVWVPNTGSHSTPPFTTVAPPPVSHISGDEFSGHQALFTLLLGLFAIGLIKLVTR